MSYKKFTVRETLQALTVEVIRRLWDRGRYRDNKWLQKVHDNWFMVWVEWRTQITMRNVDHQAEQLVKDWEEDEVDLYEFLIEDWDPQLGEETELGPPMRLRGRWKDQEDPS